MRAREHQCETVIGNLRLRRGAKLLRKALQLRRARLGALTSSGRVDGLSPRNSQEPGLRIRRSALDRPLRQSDGERLGECVLRRGNVARARRKEGDKLAVAASRDP